MSDHTLIKIGRIFERQFASVEKALHALDADLAPAAHDEKSERIVAPLNATMAAVASTTASTIEGLVIKARVATRIGGDVDTAIAISIVHDLLGLSDSSLAAPVETTRIADTARDSAAS